MAALKIVSADGIVAKSEKGLDTEVGEGGDLLSTGEKQLISFARAVLSDPKILVLDEATSSIDTFTEQLIQNALDTVIEGRTSFMIAHRLSTVRKRTLFSLFVTARLLNPAAIRSFSIRRDITIPSTPASTKWKPRTPPSKRLTHNQKLQNHSFIFGWVIFCFAVDNCRDV